MSLFVLKLEKYKSLNAQFCTVVFCNFNEDNANIELAYSLDTVSMNDFLRDGYQFY